MKQPGCEAVKLESFIFLSFPSHAREIKKNESKANTRLIVIGFEIMSKKQIQ